MYFLTRELISQPQNPQILKIQKLSKNQVQKVDVLCYVVFISLVGINAVWIVWPITRHKLSCLDFHFFETDLGFSFFLKRTLDFEKLFFYITNQQCIQNVQLDIHLHLLKVFQLTHATVNSTVDPVSINHIVDTDSENLFLSRFSNAWCLKCEWLLWVSLRVHFGRRHSPNVFCHWCNWYCLCRLLCSIVTKNVVMAINISACFGFVVFVQRHFKQCFWYIVCLHVLIMSWTL